MKKVGHLEPGELVSRGATASGFVLVLEGQVFYGFGVVRPKPLSRSLRGERSFTSWRSWRRCCR